MLEVDVVLVPTDFSDPAAVALAHARELAETHRARLVLLHIIEEPVFPSIYGAGAVALSGHAPSIEERAEAALEKLATEIGAAETASGFGCHVTRGTPATEIVRFAADHDVDLIVIASHGQSGLERMLVGSVTDRVLRTARCPLFLVQAFGKSLVPSAAAIAAEAASAST